MAAMRGPMSTPGEVWAQASAALREELGENTFGSWLAQASVCEARGGPALVAPTGFARDWIRKNAWRRVSEVWAACDPLHRPLELKSKAELEMDGGSAPEPAAEPIVAKPEMLVAPPAADTRRSGRAAGLQERFTFDSFVAGPANAFACAVARSVGGWADGHFNPVLFHGPYGFGKTHLLNAVAWEAARTAPHRTVIYMTAERFTSTFVRAVMDKSTNSFKDEVRSADLLLIDDVHFFAGKSSTQEELFHTLAALMDDGKRVVLSSDRPPAALVDMDARLRSHLSAGLVCGIEPACRNLRLGILEKKLDALARQLGCKAGARPEVLQFLADRFSDSVRELEGALNTLFASARERMCTMTLDEAQAMLRPHLRGAEKRITVDEIQKAVAEHYGLKQADLLSERRTRAVARPRQTAMYLAKQLTTRSYPDIGRRFGGRDHTTVLHAVRTIERLAAEDPALARDVEALTRRLRG
jgi:chromosomal replication initiator protein